MSGQYTMDETIDVVSETVGDDVCRHCLNARNDGTPSPNLCTECGRCYGTPTNCHDSPFCVVRDMVNYAGAEDQARVTPPTVFSIAPPETLESSDPVPIDSAISVTLSKDVDPASATAESVYLVNGSGVPVGPAQASQPTVVGGVITLHLESNLAYSTLYKVRVTKDVKDVNGESLEEEYTSPTGWTTRSSDVVAPTVVSTTPANAATGVVVSGLLPTITFSEAMNPFTFDATEGGGAPVDTITITPEDGGTTPEISGIVFSVGNTVASIFTDSAFSAGKRYKLRVSTAAHDANGNPLAVAYAQATGFTTAP